MSSLFSINLPINLLVEFFRPFISAVNSVATDFYTAPELTAAAHSFALFPKKASGSAFSTFYRSIKGGFKRKRG
jgi:hypothetical protein